MRKVPGLGQPVVMGQFRSRAGQGSLLDELLPPVDVVSAAC